MKRTSRLSIALIAFILTVGIIQANYPATQYASAEKTGSSTPQDGVEQQSNSIESTQVAGTIVRTLAYHEITALSPNGVVRDYPFISGDGSHVSYTVPGNPSRVYVANFDGTGTREVASFSDTPTKVDLSYDGSTVLVVRGGGTGFGSDVRVYNAAGGSPVTVWDKAGIGDIRLAPSGAMVFFQLRGDVSSEFKSGIWVVSANGGSLQRIVSPEQLAAVIGLSVNDLSFDNSGITCLDVSQDGTRFTFMARVQAGMRVFAGRYTGGSLLDLHQILEPFTNYGVGTAVISSDGTKVGYVVRPPANTNIIEAGVINFENVNGQGKQVLVTSDQFTSWPADCFPGGGCASYRIFLNRDGSKLLLGASSYLYDTLTRTPVQLGIEIPQVFGDSAHLVYNGFFVPSMNADATRFTYIVGDANRVEQLATCEITSSPGTAPSLSLPTIDPPFVLTNDRSRTTLTVKATASTGVSRVSAAFLRNGLDDVYVCVEDRGKPVLLDNGTQGDGTAVDTIYTNNAIHAIGGALAVPGPRVVRYQAETKTGDNKRHAAAIDVESLTVTEQTPLIDVAPTSLEFGDVTVGQTKDLSLTVRNIGGVSLTISSLAIDNARFSTPTITAPLTINAGATQTITIRFSPTATGQQRGTLTINSSDPARPTVTVALAGNGVSAGGATITDHTMTGGPVPGACAKPTVKTAFTTTDTEAIQWTFASGLSLGDAIRWEWVQPNGAAYRTFNYTLTQVAQGQACFWDAIQIAGQQAASLPGNWQVRVYIKNALVLTESFTISQSGGTCPAITGISPSSGNVGTSVTITGTGFTGVNGVKFANNVAATYIVFSDTQIVANVPSGAVSGSITVSEPNCNDAQSSTTFTVTQPSGRIVRVVCSSTTLGGTLTVPVELVSQGDENALGFSLTFDPAVLSNPQAAKGSDATSVALNTNSNQVAQGRVGIALALPTGQSFTAGVRQIAIVTFTVSATTTATTTTIGFGDTPILRRVSDANAQVLPATYQADTCATIAILRGYESDVTPRPNGKNDGTVSINDWVMVGRFAAALDAPAAGSEFQRADCAPRNTKGDGLVAVDDWVQAGRYYAALDPVQTIGGPSAPAQLRIADFVTRRNAFGQTVSPTTIRNPLPAIPDQQRVVRVANATFVRGQTGTLSIEMDSQGNENAVGFSLSFDPNVLTYVSAATGSGAPNAFLIINSSQAASGRLGLAVAQSAGESFAAGTRQVATVRFTVAASATAATTAISFGDQPVKRQIADANAITLIATYADGAITLVNSVACVSAASFRATDVASEAIIAAFGVGMATSTQEATTVPLPTQLAGTTVTIKDSLGVERLAPLFFVSPTQINYQMPPNSAVGQTAVTVRSGNGTVSLGTMPLAMVAPGLFTANATGQGVAAAVALRVKADGTQIYESVSQWDAARQQYISLPIDLGSESDQVYLILFGTGLRFLSSQSAASATIGGTAIPVSYVGPQGDYVGLDQVNLGPVPRSLSGRGEMDIVLMVDGKGANTVKVNIK